ncbi:MAG: NAD(+) synthase [Desulfitobacteriia bacterium]|jgi:NAD+ synthase (glutamine-hydrolysing)
MYETWKLGYVRVGAAVPRVQIGNPAANSAEIIALLHKAAANGVSVLVFPELSLSGYNCGDLFHQPLLLNKTLDSLQLLLQETEKSNCPVLTIVGFPLDVDNKLFDCAAVIYKGTILGIIPKTSLSNHNGFYESRWFTPSQNRQNNMVELCSQQVPFGEDLLFKDSSLGLCFGVEIGRDLLMPIPPSAQHALQGANLILNPAADNEQVGLREYQQRLITQHSARCSAAYVYSSAGPSESSVDMVFGGGLLIAELGEILAESNYQESKIIFADIDLQKIASERRRNTSFTGKLIPTYRVISFQLTPPTNLNSANRANTSQVLNLKRTFNPYPFVPAEREAREKRCREIFNIQATGLAEKIAKTKFRRAVIGISGGLDSTLALLVCIEAFTRLKLPPTQILGVTMPGFGTSNRTKNNSLELMAELGIDSREISITSACNQHFLDIGHDPEIHDRTYENVQARERTQILMDLANKESGLVVGTGDLSELALGWCTYNGDHMSHYNVNAGIPKTLIKHMVSWYASISENRNLTRILRDILATPISPELLPLNGNEKIEQKTEEVLGSYDLHDFFLYYMIRWGFSPAKIFVLACQAFQDTFEAQEILKSLNIFYRRFFSQQFKRSCFPEGPKIGSVHLSSRTDWRMPSEVSASDWLDELKKLKKSLEQ